LTTRPSPAPRACVAPRTRPALLAQPIKLIFDLVGGLAPTDQIQQLASRSPQDGFNAATVTRLNMITTVTSERQLTASRYHRCRVTERNNFRRASADLPKVIE
jgi:hypothetical protein